MSVSGASTEKESRIKGSDGRSPTEVYQQFQSYLQMGRMDKMGEVVDLTNYTENCVGLTGWTTGFEIALKNWLTGFGGAWSEMKLEIENVLEDKDIAMIRQKIEAKHTGPVLGIEPTGRRVSFEMIDLLRIKEGKIVWRWIFADLYGIEQQLKGNS